MKTTTTLSISALLGTAVIGACALLLHPGGSPEPASPTGPALPIPSTTATAARAQAPADPPRFGNTPGFDWARVESDDYVKYIANLRAIGCPAETIRDIVKADLNKLFSEREKQLAGPAQKFEFWKRQTNAAPSEALVRTRIELAREKRALYQQLMGSELDETPGYNQPPSGREQRLAFLSPDQRHQVQELEATYNARLNSLFGNRARPTPNDLAMFGQMEQERRAEVAKILAPEQAEQYELTTSRTANFMRNTMGDFAFTEDEFRKVFRVRQQWEEQNGPSFIPETVETLPAKLELDRRIRDTMGEERYRQYMQEQNWSVSSLQAVATEYGLPKEVAVKVFDLKPVAQEASARLRADETLPPEQRQVALREVQGRTMEAISELIGKDAAEAYFRQGSWIRNLSQVAGSVPNGSRSNGTMH